jgi:GGDEF domain-containing protein
VIQCALAIDDSPDVHRLLDVRLKSEGVVLHHALDAERGLSMVAGMVNAADEALYRARHEGRNRVSVATDGRGLGVP